MITERTQAILLFTSYLSKDTDKVTKPLSLTEWNKLVKWLQQKEIFPEEFLSEKSSGLLNSWNDQTISKNRLLDLLERKAALALALDKWTRAGVWVISRGDPEYPKKLKEKLKGSAPNILFGIGSQELLNKSYVGIVGSRNAGDSDLSLTKAIGTRAFAQKYGVVSGGAKGIDEVAMQSVLEVGGECVGFLADSLMKKSTSAIYRQYIINNRLALVSPFNPEAGFNTGNAMSRNKLIYALAEVAIVVISDVKGGTWEGAKENLKNNWTPLWVCPSKEKGNNEIIKIGGRALTELATFDIKEIGRIGQIKSDNNLFSDHEDKQILKLADIKSIDSFYFFLFKWYSLFQFNLVPKDLLAEKLEITKGQLEAWLDRAFTQKFAVNRDGDSDGWQLKTEIKIE